MLPEQEKSLLSSLQKRFREFDNPDVVFELCDHLTRVNRGSDNDFWIRVTETDALKIVLHAEGMGISKIGSYDQAQMA